MDNRVFWKELKSVVRITANREVGGKVSTQIWYYISSLKASSAEFNTFVRQHWGIENKVSIRLPPYMIRDFYPLLLSCFTLKSLEMASSNLSDRMYDHFCAWKSSGLSQHSYSKLNGLHVAQFNYWVLKFRSGKTSGEPKESEFIPLVVSPGDVTPIFEINHTSGHRISFYQLVDVSLIKSLLE